MAAVYSCCFWFSLRLAGIMIAILSTLQALIFLIICCVGYTHTQQLVDELDSLFADTNLLYAKDYLEKIKADPTKYTGLGISFSSIYIVICMAYAYGAYTFNNFLMIAYILAEFGRLVMLSVLVATWLLVFKQNNMDIGLLIGASVVGGFLLLGMFYLWVCATNLPILINEMEHDEKEATIAKLRAMLQAQNSKSFRVVNNVHHLSNLKYK